ncbi:MAG: hypothetical protein KGH98_03850 [Candidatus Micrarchaeota archaeon]|nr:hypothetical protein [Candidatus Micrarchaeota archaeon]
MSRKPLQQVHHRLEGYARVDGSPLMVDARKVSLTKSESNDLIEHYNMVQSGPVGGNMFFKSDVTAFSRRGISNEYHRLARIHDALPIYVPEPLTLVYSVEARRYVGMILPFVEGKPMDELMLDMTLSHRIQAACHLTTIVDVLATKGIYHWDLTARNLMVSVSGHRLELQVIDPMPTLFSVGRDHVVNIALEPRGKHDIRSAAYVLHKLLGGNPRLLNQIIMENATPKVADGLTRVLRQFRQTNSEALLLAAMYGGDLLDELMGTDLDRLV